MEANMEANKVKLVYLVRHGQSLYNQKVRSWSRIFTCTCCLDPMIYDAPLSASGEQEVETLRKARDQVFARECLSDQVKEMLDHAPSNANGVTDAENVVNRDLDAKHDENNMVEMTRLASQDKPTSDDPNANSKLGDEKKENKIANDSKHYPKHIEVIVCSPLTRALQTARGVFGDSQLPVVVSSLHVEALDTTCDIGRPPSELKEDFPEYDFSSLEQMWWYGLPHQPQKVVKEPARVVKSRVQLFVEYLWNRPEQCIAVVGHSQFFRKLMGVSYKLKNYGTATLLIRKSTLSMQASPKPKPKTQSNPHGDGGTHDENEIGSGNHSASVSSSTPLASNNDRAQPNKPRLREYQSSHTLPRLRGPPPSKDASVQLPRVVQVEHAPDDEGFEIVVLRVG